MKRKHLCCVWGFFLFSLYDGVISASVFVCVCVFMTCVSSVKNREKSSTALQINQL